MRSLLAAVTVVLLVASGCSDDEPEATPEPSPTPTATPTPTPTPAPTPEPETLDELTWESAVHPGQPDELVRVGRGYFGVETQAVARLGPGGEDVWRYQGPDSDDFRGFVIDGAPVVVPVVNPKSEATYRPHRVHGLDPRTGKVRWTRQATSRYTFTDGEHVVVPTCTGEKTGALGDCTLTAYDPATGDVAWSRAMWANVEIAQGGDGFVLLQTFPTGGAPRYVVLTPEGDVRGTIDRPEGSGILSPAGDVVVGDGPLSRPTRNGCRRGVTAWTPEGEELWRRGFRETPEKCSAASSIPVDDGVAIVSDQVPLLLDARTGKTLWEGDEPNGRVYAAADGVVFEERTLDVGSVAYDAKTGEELWSFDKAIGGWRTWRGYATTNYNCDVPDLDTCTVVVNARTGEVLTKVPGVPRTFLPPARDGEGPALLTRVDKEGYTSTYGYVTLPAL